MADGQYEVGVRLKGDGSSLAETTEKAASQQQKLQETLKNTGAAAKGASDESKRFVERLKEEAETAGKSRAELERYRAGKLQLTEAQKQSVEASLKSTEAHDRQAQSIAFVRNAALVAVATLTALATAQLVGAKTASDQAASLHNLSQTYGVSTETLSAYRYQMSLAGVGQEDFNTAIKIFTKNIGEARGGVGDGAALFRLLGRDMESAVKSGASFEQLFQMFSDKFAQFEAGPNKAALAFRFLGSAAERVLPELSKGSAGMKAAATEAANLGVIIGPGFARNADQFNTNMARSNALFTAGRNAIAADYLPALNSFIERFVVASQLVAGDGVSPFDRGANTVLKEKALDIYKAGRDRLARSGRQWNWVDEEIARRESDPQIVRLKQRDTWQKAMDEQNAAGDALGFGKMAKIKAPVYTGSPGGGPTDFQRMKGQAEEMLAIAELQLTSTEKLTEADRARLQMQMAVAQGLVKDLAPAQRMQIEETLELASMKQRELEQREKLKKAVEEGEQARVKSMDAMRQEQAQLVESNRKYGEQNEEIGLTTEELGKLKVRRAEETLAITQQNLALSQMKDSSEEELQLFRDRVAESEKFVRLVKEGGAKDVAAEQAKKAKEEWQRASDSIERSLTDALMRGFDKGKTFMQNFKDALVSMFKTLVLEPIIRPIAQMGASAVLGAFGMPGAAAASGSVFGGAGNALSLGNSIFGGGQFLADFGNFFGNIGATTELGGTFGLMDAIGGFAGANPLAALGIGAGALALGGLFGGGGGPKPGEVNLVNENGGWFHLGNNNLPGANDAANEAYLGKASEALNDPTQYDPAVLRSLLGTTVSGVSSAQDGAQQLLARLEPARVAAQAKVGADNLELARRNEEARALLTRIQETLRFSETVKRFEQESAGLALSNLSPLTNQERIDFAREQYSKTLGGARAGDADAFSQYGSAREAYLREAQSFYASSPAYTAIYSGTQADQQGLVADLNTRITDTLADSAETFGGMGLSLTQIDASLKDLPEQLAEAFRAASEKQTRAIVEALIEQGLAIKDGVFGALDASVRA